MEWERKSQDQKFYYLNTLLFEVSFSWIIGALFFGIEGLHPHIVAVQGRGWEYVSVIGEITTVYGYKLVNLVMMATFAFMISSIFRNSALEVGIAVSLMMAGNSIVLWSTHRLNILGIRKIVWKEGYKEPSSIALVSVEKSAANCCIIKTLTFGVNHQTLISYGCIFVVCLKSISFQVMCTGFATIFSSDDLPASQF